MRRWTQVAGIASIMLAVAACKPYHRTRRPRTAVPSAPIAEEPAPPPPPPRPVPAPRPAPPRPAPEPPPDRSTCGPGGKGPRFAVHGVDPADTLNVRVAPDPKSEVLGQLLPNTTGVVSLGVQQKIGPATWRKVRCGALVGWVNDRFLDPQQESTERRTSARRM